MRRSQPVREELTQLADGGRWRRQRPWEERRSLAEKDRVGARHSRLAEE